MERLWAPWRSGYISGLGHEEGCILCKIPEADDESRYILKRKKTFYAVLNLYPYNSGHIMVVPFRHLSDISEFTPEESLEMVQLMAESLKALKEAFNPDGFNIGANLGRLAGAGVEDHVHFHIVPRWGGDTNFMAVLGETKVVSAPLDETYAKLRRHFPRG